MKLPATSAIIVALVSATATASLGNFANSNSALGRRSAHNSYHYDTHDSTLLSRRNAKQTKARKELMSGNAPIKKMDGWSDRKKQTIYNNRLKVLEQHKKDGNPQYKDLDRRLGNMQKNSARINARLQGQKDTAAEQRRARKAQRKDDAAEGKAMQNLFNEQGPSPKQPQTQDFKMPNPQSMSGGQWQRQQQQRQPSRKFDPFALGGREAMAMNA